MKIKKQKLMIRIGGRSSLLSRIQMHEVSLYLCKKYPFIKTNFYFIKTKGDVNNFLPIAHMSNIGVFTENVNKALKYNKIDIAVHSYKDLPWGFEYNIIIPAILERKHSSDAIVSKLTNNLNTIPNDTTIGTSSIRRKAALLYYQPNFHIVPIRGNLGTRINKMLNIKNKIKIIILSFIGIKKIKLHKNFIGINKINNNNFISAPSQGAMVIQCKNNYKYSHLLKKINNYNTTIETLIERSFLRILGGTCCIPIAASAQYRNNTLIFKGQIFSPKGNNKIQLFNINKIFHVNQIRFINNAYSIGAMAAKSAILYGSNNLTRNYL